jgi:glycerophosphoryl diester phosphodiesterase
MTNRQKIIDRFILDRPLNIAHRGARSLAPENTLAAARRAAMVEADMWELDVRLSADGVPVVVHDESLIRTSNVTGASFPAADDPWPVQKFTLSELKALDFGSWFALADPFGQIALHTLSSSETSAYQGETIPTLAEALTFSSDRGLMVNVEIKDLTGLPGDTDIVEQVVRDIESVGMVERVIISSFNMNYIRQSKQLLPEAAVGFISDRELPAPADLLEAIQADAYHPHQGCLAASTISDLRKKGFLVNVWTVNDPQRMNAFIDQEVTGIITDFPQLLRQALKSKERSGKG